MVMMMKSGMQFAAAMLVLLVASISSMAMAMDMDMASSSNSSSRWSLPAAGGAEPKPAVPAPAARPPSRLLLHVHIYQEGNFVTLVKTSPSTHHAPPSGEAFVSARTRLRSIDIPITSAASVNLTNPIVVGAARGLAHETYAPANSASSAFIPPGREQLFEVIEYDDGTVSGTIELHGQMNFPPHPDDEVAVVGGTKSFRCAQGYALPSLVKKIDTFVLFQWDLRLFYPTPLCTQS